MSAAASLDVDAMRTWLEHVRQPETVRRLMQGIAIGEGTTPDEIARWYDEIPRVLEQRGLTWPYSPPWWRVRQQCCSHLRGRHRHAGIDGAH